MEVLFLTQVLEEHESKMLAWHEQGVPLAKEHVPTVELADVSNCLAGMSLANIYEVILLPLGLLDHQQPGCLSTKHILRVLYTKECFYFATGVCSHKACAHCGKLSDFFPC